MDQAIETMKVTYKRGTKSVVLPPSRRYKADRYYSVKKMDGKFSTDTVFPTLISYPVRLRPIYTHTNMNIQSLI